MNQVSMTIRSRDIRFWLNQRFFAKISQKKAFKKIPQTDFERGGPCKSFLKIAEILYLLPDSSE